MNHNLNNTEIARIFGSYISHQIIILDELLTYIYSVSENYVLYHDKELNLRPGDFKDCKLLLTPLEKITEEDAVNISQIFDIERADQGSLEDVLSWVKALFEEPAGYYLDGYMGSQLLTFVSYLKLKGYDLPQYFGKDHPDNGKTLIQMGIAIDKTELR